MRVQDNQYESINLNKYEQMVDVTQKRTLALLAVQKLNKRNDNVDAYNSP